MRCIEIKWLMLQIYPQNGLIETWDVLKFSRVMLRLIIRTRLIETWDVLKSDYRGKEMWNYKD